MFIYNPLEKVVEFTMGGQQHIFQPRESREVSSELFKFATDPRHSPLIELSHGKESRFTTDYNSIAWKSLTDLGGKRGVYKFGMSRTQLVEALKKDDEKDDENDNS